MKLKSLLILLILLIHSPLSALADTIDEKVNAIYDRMSAAYLSLDGNQMKTVYVEDGAYMPNSKDAKLLKGRSAIVADSARHFQQLKDHKAKMTIEFRVIDRKQAPGMVTDIGFFKISLTPSKESGREPRFNFGKFLITAVESENGEWAFYNDLDTKSTESAYTNAKPIDGWKFDS